MLALWLYMQAISDHRVIAKYFSRVHQLQAALNAKTRRRADDELSRMDNIFHRTGEFESMKNSVVAVKGTSKIVGPDVSKCSLQLLIE